MHMQSDLAGEHTLRVIAKAGKFNEWLYKIIRPYFKGTILEIGSGLGNISQYAVREGLTITLSDYNPEYCSYLQQHFGIYQNVRSILSIDLQEVDFFKTYANLKEQFDTIYLLNVVEHLADDKEAIANCRYLLKNGGKLIILVPAFSWLYCELDKNLGHFKRYSVSGLKQLLKNDFTIVHYQYANALGLAGWLLYGKILRRPLLQQQEMQAYNNLVPLAKFADRFLNQFVGLSIVFIVEKC